MRSATKIFQADFLVLILSLLTATIGWNFVKINVNSDVAMLILFLGIILSFLLFGITFSLTSSHRRAEILADRMTIQFKESEEKFQLFMNNNPAAAWIKNTADWKNIYFNKSFLDIFSPDGNNFLKKTDYEIWPKEIADQLRQNDETVFRSGKPLNTLEIVPIPGKGNRTWQVNKFLIKLSTGQSLVGGMGIDVTESEKRKTELERMNDLMVGRELKMIELKKEIAKLKNE